MSLLKKLLTKKPYWVARYRDGKETSEFDLDWSLLPKKGLVELRLHCPNGQVGVLGNSIDASDRLFQLKVGVMLAGISRSTISQVIGIITDTNGACNYLAWDYNTRSLVSGKDNVNDMKYQQIGPISLHYS